MFLLNIIWLFISSYLQNLSLCILSLWIKERLNSKQNSSWSQFLWVWTWIYASVVVKHKYSKQYYVYWTVHHLNSWIKRDQLDVTCFIITLFNAQHVSDVNTSILTSLRLICWVISWVVLLWFDACWCYFVVWLGWCGIRIQAERIEPEQYNPWNNSTNKSQAPEDGCINIRNMLSIK